MSGPKKSTDFPVLSNPNKGGVAPTGRYKPEVGLAKKQQHHDRPEYAAQTALQSQFRMGGDTPQEAKRKARAALYVPKAEQP